MPPHQMPPLNGDDLKLSPPPSPSAWWGVGVGAIVGLVIGMTYWIFPQLVDIPRPTNDRSPSAETWVMWAAFAATPILLAVLVVMCAPAWRRHTGAALLSAVPVTLFFLSF